MTQPLDTTVASVVFAARLLEKAVHDPGPWAMTYGPFIVPATRVEIEGGVRFEATLPEHCYLQPPMTPLGLVCNKVLVASKDIEHPGDGATEVTWTIQGATAPVPV